MNKILLSAALVPLAAGCAALANDSGQPSMLEQRDAVRMTAWLQDKVPGEAQGCISLAPNTRSTVIGDSTILFESQGVVYRNEIPGGCLGLNSRRTISYNTFGTRLCRGENFNVLQSATGAEITSCSFGEFVPYRERDG